MAKQLEVEDDFFLGARDCCVRCVNVVLTRSVGLPAHTGYAGGLKKCVHMTISKKNTVLARRVGLPAHAGYAVGLQEIE